MLFCSEQAENIHHKCQAVWYNKNMWRGESKIADNNYFNQTIASMLLSRYCNFQFSNFIFDRDEMGEQTKTH